MRVRAKTIVLSLLAVLLVLVLVIISKVGWQVVLGPHARPVTANKFDPTEARLARGQYLVEGPAHCLFCHSDHDLSNPEYPVIPSTRGAGWKMPIPELNYISSKNITSDKETGLGNWTDDEIARAIREGVRKDGTALFPVMPYLAFAKLDDEDVASIVVYLRTLPPINHAVPARNLPFPLEHIVKTIPTPITTPQPSHPSANAADRGKYLVTMAGCADCHTPSDDRGQKLAGMDFAGGELFRDPGQNGKEVFTMNITPDPSGIAHYDEALLTQTLHTGQVSGRMLNHIMPFEQFKNITDADVADIFAFLKTVTPVKHRISNTDPPTPCPLCKHSHGLGNLNVVASK
jgi:mono/diheme cytochrome c family protein